MERAKNAAQFSLEGKKLEFKSKRSFWKWAIGDAKKRLWSGLLVGFGGLLGKGLSLLWPLMPGIGN